VLEKNRRVPHTGGEDCSHELKYAGQKFYEGSRLKEGESERGKKKVIAFLKRDKQRHPGRRGEISKGERLHGDRWRLEKKNQEGKRKNRSTKNISRFITKKKEDRNADKIRV